MGEGTFGKVAECWDRELKKYVGVKIVRAIQKYREAAMIEMEILETLQRYDPDNKQPIVRLLSWFNFRGHVCMVFEKLGSSLFDLLQRNHYRPFYFKHIQEFSRNILEGVACKCRLEFSYSFY